MKTSGTINLKLQALRRDLGSGSDHGAKGLEKRMTAVRKSVSPFVEKALNETQLAEFIGRSNVKAVAIAAQTGSTNVGGSILVKKKDGKIESLDFSIDDRSHGKYDTITPGMKGSEYINNSETEEGRLELNALFDLFAFVSKHAKTDVQAYQSHAGIDLNTLINKENLGAAKRAVTGHLREPVDFDKNHYFIRNNRNVAGVNSYIKDVFPERMPLHFGGMLNAVFPEDREINLKIPHATNASEVFNPGAERKFTIDMMNDSEGPLNYATKHLPKGINYEGRNAIHIIGGTGCNVAIGKNLTKSGEDWNFSGGTVVTEAGHDASSLFDGGWDHETFGKFLEPFRNRSGKPGMSSYEDLVAGCPKEDVDRGIKGTFNYIKALQAALNKGISAVDDGEFKSIKNSIPSGQDELRLHLEKIASILELSIEDIMESPLITENDNAVKDSYEIQKAAEPEVNDKFAQALLKNWTYRVGRLLAERYTDELKDSAYISFTGSHIVRCMEKVTGLKDSFKKGLSDGGIPNFGDKGEKLIFMDSRDGKINEDEKWDNTYFMAKKYLVAA
jgi:hypothetical protein